jgi:hypothetical protein
MAGRLKKFSLARREPERGRGQQKANLTGFKTVRFFRTDGTKTRQDETKRDS